MKVILENLLTKKGFYGQNKRKNVEKNNINNTYLFLQELFLVVKLLALFQVRGVSWYYK